MKGTLLVLLAWFLMLLCSSLLLHLLCFCLSVKQSVFLFSPPKPTATCYTSSKPFTRSERSRLTDFNVPTVMLYIPHSSSGSSSFTPDLNVNPPVLGFSLSPHPHPPSDSISCEPAAGGLRRRRRPQPLLHGLPVFPGQDALRRPRLRSLSHSLHP